VWSCSFDQTIFEFFLYPNETSSADAAATSSAYSSSSTGTSVSSSQTTEYPTWDHPLSTTPTTMPPSDPTSWSGSIPTSGWPAPERHRRDIILEESRPVYPKWIKMLEKRKTGPNPPGVCVKMMVQPDWSLVAIPGVDTIQVDTNDYPPPAATTNKARMRLGRDSTEQLESNCACEYSNF
jgi:hypothetical protein